VHHENPSLVLMTMGERESTNVYGVVKVCNYTLLIVISYWSLHKLIMILIPDH